MTAHVGTLRALYTADGAFPVHVVRENGLPDVALTVARGGQESYAGDYAT
jgi:hypothetical protein